MVWPVVGLTAALVAFGIGGASAQEIPPTIPQSASDPLTDGSQPIVPREIRAQVTTRISTTLAAPMAGRITELSIRDGDRFKEGDVLVRFDCAVQEGQLAHSLAVLAKNRRIEQVNERLRKLGSVSVKEMNASEADVATAAADVTISRAMVERCTVKAPISGRVAGVEAKRYQFIGEGQPMLDILDDTTLELEAIVPSVWLRWLGVGFTFQVAVGETGKSHPAKVTRLSGRVDPVSQSVKIYAAITADAPDLLPGMSGRAMITPPIGVDGDGAVPPAAGAGDPPGTTAAGKGKVP